LQISLWYDLSSVADHERYGKAGQPILAFL
jgi:hypothetical protein